LSFQPLLVLSSIKRTLKKYLKLTFGYIA